MSVKGLLEEYAAGERDFCHRIIDDSMEVSLKGVDLSGIDLSNSTLRFDLSGAIVRNANFRDAVWDYVSWEDVDFSGSDFTGFRNYTGCAFIRCNFNDTIWTGADLWQVGFVECTFNNADFGDPELLEASCELHFMSEREYFGG